MRNRHLTAILGITLLLGVLVVQWACHAGDPAGNNNTPPDCVLDGVCTGAETCLSCPADCCVSCDLETVTRLPSRDYLVTEIRWPETIGEAEEFGLDLDGDGSVDNKVGKVVSLMAGNGALINEFIARRVARGELLLVLRVWADNLQQDGEVAVQLLPAEMADATPVFDGQDEVRIASASPRDRYGCGDLQAGHLVTAPGKRAQPLPSPMGRVVNDWMRFHSLRIAGDLNAEQLVDVVVAGAIDEADVQHVLLSDMLVLINEEMGSNPDHPFVDNLADMFDGNCDSGLPGCENAVSGEGECDFSADPPDITETELHCSGLGHAVTSPDVDSDGDGVYDLLSGAWRISAVPVTIVE